MSYAIFVTGGKQHRVQEGETLKIDYLKDLKKGESLTFDNVLMVKAGDDYKIGTPAVGGAKVEAKIMANGENGEGEKDKKIIVFKKNRRQGYMKKQGHRQRFTSVQIVKISA
ncbi:MAG: 50S ribosomal protein L21 [Deltaproteobacteria bacterium]|nr:50S ribosomal protein L21 [Deltaproteobacteria bacterium]